ncbi:MAG: bifunctional folylpolyglutamate synthase/dihydrofolate synthase [Actinobacteria bacterium]|nr:MAG: bifunctional folylpolyglutamate synthase/dihydrofolate synthase [Actinomycetota bacterium]
MALGGNLQGLLFSMNYEESIDYLRDHIEQGVKPGLERMEQLLEAMGSPHVGYPIIHVAGTNGKTSTSRMATLLLVGHGLATGTYISPHLQRVEERFSINGRHASPEDFALAVTDVAVFADLLEERGSEPHTYFELTTAAAFAFFAEKAVNSAVLEVGLGGRLDATNVVDADVSVVTGIGVEHTEFLGEDIATIAGEKLGIVGPGSILVTGDLPDDALAVAHQKARELGIQHRVYEKDFGISSAERGIRGWQVTVDGAETTYDDIFLPVHGRHQLHNFAVAVAAVEALLGRRLDVDAVREAMLTLTLPGRMEPVDTSPLVLLDGAHNADGVTTLVAALEEEYANAKWQIVLGIMGDKNIDAMIETLSRIADGFVVTAPKSKRATPPAELAKRVSGLSQSPILVADEVDYALDMARAEAGPDGHVLVAGSLYLVGEARDHLV